MQSGKKVLLVFFALLFVAIGFIFWVGATGGGTANRPPASNTAPPAAESSPSAGASVAASGSTQSAAAAHVRDKRVRDELRQRILAGWAASGSDADEETRNAARAGRFVPRPDTDGKGVDKETVQAILKQDLVPMARKCFEELLVRQPDAGGRIEMEFTIAGDDKIGGIVEEAGLSKTSALQDERFATCLRESVLTLSFPPPAHDGVTTIVAPITFRSEKRDE